MEAAVRGKIDLHLPHISMVGRVGGISVSGINIVGWSRDVTFGYGLNQKLVRAIAGRKAGGKHL
jgi:hypothetical protein